MTSFTFTSLKTQYDASGDIVWRKDSEVSVRYVQALGETWAETRVSGSGSATFWHHTDHEGTSEVVTDSSGSIVWEASYEAYGAVIRTNATMSFTPSYTGKEFDPDIGLYYYNARWYDPDLGRFITEDPARDGVNWFAYCNENPIRYIDPTGLDPLKADGGGEEFVTPGLDFAIRDVNELLNSARDYSISAVQNSPDPVSWIGNSIAAVGLTATAGLFPDNLYELQEMIFCGAEFSKIPKVDIGGILTQGKAIGSKAIEKIIGKGKGKGIP
ncbi:MAG TPA: RHS repeat-associated core domain-containing protein, partial [Treponemataceae bacterium]|nr:RHS repeat-associated core domain-containing protein [Treponemataceae bacterium]